MKQKLDKAGGQAVIKGVMMLSGEAIATATIRQDKTIELCRKRFSSVSQKSKWLRLPIVRGFINFLQMMRVGYSVLQYSADRAMLDEKEQKAKSKTREKLENGLTFLFSLALGVSLFVGLPYFLAEQFPASQGEVWFNLIAGSLRVLVFLAYLLTIGMLKDVKELFQFHGAEHKTINTYEKKLALEPAIISKATRINPRCGTSFIFLVLFISIILFSILDSMVSVRFGRPNLALRISYHLLCIPLVAGVSYEVLKFSDKHIDNKLVAFFISPGLLLQKITTKEPSLEQIEVAIVALKGALDQSIDPAVRKIEV